MSIVGESVLKELQEVVAQSKRYKITIDNSKTNAKALFFTKKLEKNNKIVANLLLALDRIEKTQYNMGSLEDNLK